MHRSMPHLDGVSHDYVQAGAVRLHVAEAGEGSPLVLLHGWPQNWWLWRHVIPVLAREYRVICPDFRGYGWSEAPSEGYEKDRWADDILALLDALDIERCALMGHDWGGVVGFRLCLRDPSRFARFIALGTGHPYMRLGPRDLLRVWRIAYQFLLAAPLAGRLAMEPIVRQIGARERWWDDGDTEVFAGQFRERERAEAAVLTYRTFLKKELVQNAVGSPGTLITPTLMLQGERDPVVRPSMLEGFEKHAEDMTLEPLAGVGHWIPEQVPDLVCERAAAFFGQED